MAFNGIIALSGFFEPAREGQEWTQHPLKSKADVRSPAIGFIIGFIIFYIILS